MNNRYQWRNLVSVHFLNNQSTTITTITKFDKLYDLSHEVNVIFLLCCQFFPCYQNFSFYFPNIAYNNRKVHNFGPEQSIFLNVC